MNLQRIRLDTPGCARVIHLNNAGAALMPRPVVETVKAHLDLEAAIGGYEAARLESIRLEHTYDALATLLSCHRDEIAVVESATRAWSMGFYAVAFKPGDRILTSRAEYASNFIAFLQVAQKTGARIEIIPSDETGQVDVEALDRMADERVRLVAITHVPTNGGLVNPAAEVGRVARACGALYLLDACQSVGQMPVNVADIGCDLLSATSRKYLRGPRGVGFLYVRRGVLDQLEPPMLDLHSADWVTQDRFEMKPTARRFENWEANLAAKLGLAAAVDYALELGIDAIWARVQALAERLRAILLEVPGVRIRDLGRRRCGIVSFTLDGTDPEELRLAMLDRGINLNVSRAPSTLLDMQARELREVVRASVHYYNTDDELERFRDALALFGAAHRVPARA